MTLEQQIADRLVFMRSCRQRPFSLTMLRKLALASVEIFLSDPELRDGIDPDLRCLKYNPENSADNTVFVELDGKQEVEGQTNYPLITVKLGDVTPERVAMDNRGDLEEDEHDDGATDNIVYQMRDVVISCEVEAKTYDQTLALCEGLMVHLIGLQPALLALDKVRAVAPAGITMPKKSTKNAPSTEGWIGAVGVRLHVDYAVTQRQETLLLKKAETHIQQTA